MKLLNCQFIGAIDVVDMDGVWGKSQPCASIERNLLVEFIQAITHLDIVRNLSCASS